MVPEIFSALDMFFHLKLVKLAQLNDLDVGNLEPYCISASPLCSMIILGFTPICCWCRTELHRESKVVFVTKAICKRVIKVIVFTGIVPGENKQVVKVGNNHRNQTVNKLVSF